MTALNEVHVHSAPEGRIDRVNKLDEVINGAPIWIGATKAVKKFRQRFHRKQSFRGVGTKSQHAEQRAVRVKNAGHPYKIGGVKK